MTFAAVFAVIMYRITISALLASNPDPQIKSSVRVTVTATAVIINLVVILILDEIYGSVAVWLTELGTFQYCVFHVAVKVKVQAAFTVNIGNVINIKPS